MREDEFDIFSAMLDDVAELLPRAGGQPLSGTAKAMYFRVLGEHDIDAVRKALDAHAKDAQRGRFFPTPADLVAQLHDHDDGRPGPEEAWAMAISASDERETVVWTDEMAAAWATASSILEARDEVGARMAFKEAYNRHIGEARNQRKPVQWIASLGHDESRRRLALDAAVNCGRLGAPDVSLLLPPPDPAPSEIPAEAAARMRALRERLQSAMNARHRAEIAERANIDDELAAVAERLTQAKPRPLVPEEHSPRAA